MIVTSGDLLLTVVNDVLDYSKLESGNVDIVVRRSNLQGALDAVVHSISQKSRTKNLEVKTFYGNSVPEYVETNSRRLQQILYNLLGNAVKFSKEGGTVELRVDLIERNNNERQQQESNADPASKCPFVGTTIEEVSHQSPKRKKISKCPFHPVDNKEEEEEDAKMIPTPLEADMLQNDDQSETETDAAGPLSKCSFMSSKDPISRWERSEGASSFLQFDLLNAQ